MLVLVFIWLCVGTGIGIGIGIGTGIGIGIGNLGNLGISLQASVTNFRIFPPGPPGRILEF